jgi:REP element-mobilizing transposase RayT
LSIGGTRDHVHILLGLRPTQSVSSILMEIKRDSSEWINRNRFLVGKFKWQEGYGAFAHSKSQIAQVANYIENQEKHHKGYSFADEFKKILDDLGVEYNEQYMFRDR